MFNKFYKNKKIERYGDLNSYDVYKNIAFFTMLIDHIGYFLFPRILTIRLIGRIAMIIFGILYGLSFKKEHNRSKILIFAIITFFINMYEGSILPLNVLFNFYISGFLILELQNLYDKYYILFCVLLFLFLPVPLIFMTNTFIEYGAAFIGLMMCGIIFKKDKKNIKDIISTILIFFLYLYYQRAGFRFNNWQSVVLAVFGVIIYWSLFNFRIKPIKINNKIFKNILIFISRSSLELYSLHIFILIMIKQWFF
jgi:hypothetical protein